MLLLSYMTVASLVPKSTRDTAGALWRDLIGDVSSELLQLSGCSVPTAVERQWAGKLKVLVGSRAG